MNKFNIHLLATLFTFISTLSAQKKATVKGSDKNVPQNVDPRKFIKVYDQRKDNSDAKLISAFPSRQLINFIDESSCVLIDFDLRKLSNDSLFFGSLSLKAKINEREVQVDGYTQIGQKEKNIGLSDAFSSYDFASALVGMLQAAAEYTNEPITRRSDQQNGNIPDSSRFMNDYILPVKDYTVLQIDTGLVGFYLRAQPAKAPFNYTNFIYNYISIRYQVPLADSIASFPFFSRRIPSSLRKLQLLNGNSISDVRKEVVTLKNLYTITQVESEKNNQELRIIDRKKSKKKTTDTSSFAAYLYDYGFKMPIFKEYVDYFIKTNPNALEALSIGLERDPVFINHIVTGLSTEMKRFSLIQGQINNIQKLINDNSIDEEMFVDSIRIIQDQIYRNRRNFESSVQQLKAINTVYVIPTYANYLSNKSSGTLRTDSLRTNIPEIIESDLPKIYQNMEFRSYLKQKISTKTAIYAFSLLNTGSIDLKLLDAKEGDNLRIYVEWSISREVLKTDHSFDTIKKTILLPVANLNVKKLGWSVKVSDSFFLINRIHNDANDVNAMSSRFVGAPGGSALINYGNDKRKFIKYIDTLNGGNRLVPDETKKRILRRFCRALEPSFGINVSYVNFDSQKDFEVATGLVIGFFRNTILFTGGCNLNMPTHPLYIGIGFSFGQVYQNIRTGFKYKD